MCVSCLTLSDPMDHNLPGSSVHGIFQARVLEWGAIAFCGVCVYIYIYIYIYMYTTTPQFISSSIQTF